MAVAVDETITLEEVGALTLKGLTQPVVAYNVPLAAIQPALRVIEGGPQSVCVRSPSRGVAPQWRQWGIKSRRRYLG